MAIQNEVSVRSGTTAEWADTDASDGSGAPVLGEGELGIDNTTGEVKVGDGTSAWSALRSVTPKRSSVTLVGGTKVTADTSIKSTSIIVPVVKTLGTVTTAKALLATVSAGVSYTVTSADATDTSVVNVLIYY